MKKGDRVIVISESSRHSGKVGTVTQIKSNEILVRLDGFIFDIMFYKWNLSVHVHEKEIIPEPRELFMLFDQAGRKYGKNCTSLKAITEEAKSAIRDGQTLYIFKCIGEVNSKIVKTTNSIIY